MMHRRLQHFGEGELTPGRPCASLTGFLWVGDRTHSLPLWYAAHIGLIR